MTAQRISFTGQPITVQRDAVRTSGIQLTGEQHQFQMCNKMWEGFIQLSGLHLAERTVEFCPVRQKMQAITFLHQPGSEVRRDISFKTPGLDSVFIHHFIPVKEGHVRRRRISACYRQSGGRAREFPPASAPVPVAE